MLTNLAEVVRGAGLRVEETPGWQSRGYKGQSLTETRGVMWHHTVGPRTGNMPSLQVLINGRPSVPGPLCQLGLGRDGTVYVIAAGLSHHAGYGQIADIPRDQGNLYLIGVEMESAGTPPWDWTPAQIDAAPRLGAALERAYLMHRPADLRLQVGHKEYSSKGNEDPAGWPGDMDGLRDSINRILDGSNPAPAPRPQPQPQGPRIQAPLATPVNRVVTNPNAYVRTAPRADAPLYATYPTGTPIAVIGHVAGQDPYRTGDNAWYKTKSGYFLWANAAQNDVSGLPYLGAV